MEAEVYSYSRSKGLFAGISLSGSAISVDAKANESFFGNDDDAKTIFANTESDSANVQALKDVLKGMVE
jgi:lipid-binding SYLF domain-containing protein